MKPQIDKEDHQDSPIKVKKAARSGIRVMTGRGYDKPPRIRRSWQVDRTGGRLSIIVKSRGEVTMKAIGGAREGEIAMGQGLAVIALNRGGVGNYGTCRQQRKAVQ